MICRHESTCTKKSPSCKLTCEEYIHRLQQTDARRATTGYDAVKRRSAIMRKLKKKQVKARFGR